MATIKGEIRRSQLITTYGVGSIVALEDESFMVAGIDRWEPALPDLHEPRLERRLGVQGFRVPPASEDRPDIPVVRFPTWAHCPACKRLDRHTSLTSLFKNLCNRCSVPLVPSRFVICCENGHIDDFPYFNWVHAGSPRVDGDHRMEIESAGNTASLRSILITCTCGKRATMEDAFQRHAMRNTTRCKGRRPWLTTDDPECDKLPRTLQRGASNVWFSITHSALSIPPWSEGAFKLLSRRWDMLRHLSDETALRGVLEGLELGRKEGYSVDDLIEAVWQRQAGEQESGDDSAEGFRRDEYRALLGGRPESSKDQQFVCVPVERLPEPVRPWISKAMLVKRLREVRALESFSRLTPPSADPDAVNPPLYDERQSWLPAVEINGEGVFFVVDETALTAWEGRQEVKDRVARLDANYKAKFADFGGAADRVITPRLVLIHTLAHALITQWALDSGYPTSSLRERLYVADDMHGFLIYTATSDSAGSLGGVVAEAEPDRLEVTFPEALVRAGWCSADPLCLESEPSGVDGLNLAACHACALLPEVSCEEMNLLLDRGLLVGTPDDLTIGLFADLVS